MALEIWPSQKYENTVVRLNKIAPTNIPDKNIEITFKGTKHQNLFCKKNPRKLVLNPQMMGKKPQKSCDSRSRLMPEKQAF